MTAGKCLLIFKSKDIIWIRSSWIFHSTFNLCVTWPLAKSRLSVQHWANDLLSLAGCYQATQSCSADSERESWRNQSTSTPDAAGVSRTSANCGQSSSAWSCHWTEDQWTQTCTGRMCLTNCLLYATSEIKRTFWRFDLVSSVVGCVKKVNWCRVQLVHKWVTVSERANHFCM